MRGRPSYAPVHLVLYVPVHLPGQSGSRVSLPGSLDATTDLSGSALGSALREEPPDPLAAQRAGKEWKKTGLVEWKKTGPREVPNWFHSARTRPPESWPIMPNLFRSF